MITTFDEILIETAREFPQADALEVAHIAAVRAERAENKPIERGNLYTRVLSHFDENGNPVFKWENWG